MKGGYDWLKSHTMSMIYKKRSKSFIGGTCPVKTLPFPVLSIS